MSFCHSSADLMCLTVAMLVPGLER
jgi:hypothetical protein